MSFLLEVLSKAQAEMADAVDWYEQQQIGLGRRFISNVDELFERISEYPFHFPEKNPPFREASVMKFPYLVIYQVRGECVVIYSVFHVRQDPEKKYSNK